MNKRTKRKRGAQGAPTRKPARSPKLNAPDAPIARVDEPSPPPRHRRQTLDGQVPGTHAAQDPQPASGSSSAADSHAAIDPTAGCSNDENLRENNRSVVQAAPPSTAPEATSNASSPGSVSTEPATGRVGGEECPQAEANGRPSRAFTVAASGRTQPATGLVATGPVRGPEKYLETTYRDAVITKSPATLAEILRFDHDVDVDAHINEVTGRIVIRPQAGAVFAYNGSIPGVGPDVGRVLLEQLMWRPGEYLTVEDLLKKPELESFEGSDARAVCVTRLLTAFGEDREHPWFFELAYHPWRIRWNPARSWRIIERLA